MTLLSSTVFEDIIFTKMHACGNDFIIIDDRAELLRDRESDIARHVCRRRLSLGADGLLVLRNGTRTGAFGMVFVNADGMVGEMCGNGARCLAAYLRRIGLAADCVELQTLAGTVSVRYLPDGLITLNLPAPVSRRSGLLIDYDGRQWSFDEIDVGPPHVVCWLPDVATLDSAPVFDLGRFVRHHPTFHDRGCNVNFAAPDGLRMQMRTYERGVEDETLGCGTGATAVAILAHRRGWPASPIEVITRSGDVLRIDPGDDRSGPCLTGDAHFVASGAFVVPRLIFQHGRPKTDLGFASI